MKPKIIDLTPPGDARKYKDFVREKAGADWFEVSPEVAVSARMIWARKSERNTRILKSPARCLRN